MKNLLYGNWKENKKKERGRGKSTQDKNKDAVEPLEI